MATERAVRILPECLLVFNINFSQVQDYVRRSCDALCHRLAENIITCYKDNLHLKEDPVYDDVIQHRTFALEKNSLFVGRKELLSRIVTKSSDFSAKKPIVIHGQSGKKCEHAESLLMIISRNENVI